MYIYIWLCEKEDELEEGGKQSVNAQEFQREELQEEEELQGEELLKEEELQEE